MMGSGRTWEKRSRTRAGPTPTNISMKSLPLMDKNGTPASPAVAFASSVLPVPGGPTYVRTQPATISHERSQFRGQ